VEAQLRDTKGCRFGVRLEWTPFRTPTYGARFTWLVGVALGLGTAVVQAVAQQAPRVRPPGQRKCPRLSLPPPQLRRFPWLHGNAVVP
jgi:hypothetical protein